MSEDIFTVGLVQHACCADREENFARAEKGISEAASRGAQIICLPELFASPYFPMSEETQRFDLAEAIPGESTERLGRLAKKLQVVVIAPLFEKRAPGVYHNSAAVIDADGTLLGAYRKMHIPDDPLFYEKFYFTPGDVLEGGGGFQVFETRYAKIGVLICWDQWYPEAARITSLLGAEILFYPTAIGWHPKEKREHGARQADAWATVQRGHSIANGVYVASVNRFGHERKEGTDGIEFFGQSFISDPFGEILSQASTDAAEVLISECSRKHLEEIRRNWPFLRDRRIDAYDPIQFRFVSSR